MPPGPFLLRRLLFPMLACLVTGSAVAQSSQPYFPPSPMLEARAWVLLDAGSGQVLAQQQADSQQEPGALVRLMQAWVILNALRDGRLQPEQRVRVSALAAQAAAPRMGLEEGTDATVAQLLDGLLTVSANDAAVALGETLSGSRETFVEQMNAEARRLGLEATSLRNLTGESALGQRSSAADLARLTARLQQAFPEESLRFRQRELNWRGTRQENPNRLLWLDPSIEGLFLSGAELRGAGFIGSAQRGTRRMVAVVLGAPNAVAAMREALKLLNHGFQAFDGVRLYAPGESVAQVPVTRGNRAQARLGFSQGLLLSLPVDFQGRLQPRLHTRQPLRAPLSAGDPAGSLSLTLDDQLLGEFPVQVLEDVPEAALPGRVWDDVTDWLKSGNRPPAREDAR